MPSIVDARRVLFVRTDRLGETLLNLPAIAALKSALPQASVTLLVHPDLQGLMERLPGVSRVLSYGDAEARWWWLRAIRCARLLRSARFELAIVSNPKKELHLAVWLAGIPCRVGYARKWGQVLLTRHLEDRKALGERHEVEYNLDLVRALGVPVAVPECRLPCFDRERADVLQLLEQQGVKPAELFIAIHPWTSNPSKQWPVERFRALIEQAVQRLRVQVVLVGGPEEQRRVAEVLPVRVPVADLVGRLTLGQLAALLQEARLLVSNDSGPVHLAAAVGTRTVVLFGTPSASSGPRRWGPWGHGHAVIWKPSIMAIELEEVVGAVQRLLGP